MGKNLRKASREDDLWVSCSSCCDRSCGRRDSASTSRGIHNAAPHWVCLILSLQSHSRIGIHRQGDRIPLRRLDDLGMSYLRPDSVLFLKADVQGFEDRVLKGAERLFEKAVGVHLEVTLVPLYKDQCLYYDLENYLRNRRFELWDLKPEYFDSMGRLIWGSRSVFPRLKLKNNLNS